MTGDVLARVRELRYADGMSCPLVAAAVGLHPGTVRRLAPGRPGKIDNARVREAFRSGGVSAVEVAWRIGWRGDGARVERALGLRCDVGGDRGRFVTWRRMLDAETAAAIAGAVGVAGWAVGYFDGTEATS